MEKQNCKAKINIIFDIVNNLYDKKYKIDNFRKIVENMIDLFNLKFVLFIKENFGYYIDKDKYFFISNSEKLSKYKKFLKNLLNNEHMLVLNNCNKEYKIFKKLGEGEVELHLYFLKIMENTYIIGAREIPFSTSEITILSKIKAVIRKSIEQDILENTLLEQAYTDQLTGLYNRRFLEKIIPIEIERSKRYKYPLSVIYIDLDNFKILNDTYGHITGDIFLRRFGNLLKDILRKADIPIRLGGDEFLIFLPFTRKKDAEALAYKIRKVILDNRDYLCERKGCDYIDLSFGVIEVDKTDTLETVLSKADNIMYQAKRRKRVTIK